MPPRILALYDNLTQFRVNPSPFAAKFSEIFQFFVMR